jgi:hypothetical protein
MGGVLLQIGHKGLAGACGRLILIVWNGHGGSNGSQNDYMLS